MAREEYWLAWRDEVIRKKHQQIELNSTAGDSKYLTQVLMGNWCFLVQFKTQWEINVNIEIHIKVQSMQEL